MALWTDWRLWVTAVGGAGAALAVTSADGNLSSRVIGALKDALTWLVDPSKMINLGFDLFGSIIGAMGSVMPGEVGSKFVSFGDSLSGVPVSKAVAVVGYMASPVIDPALFLGCLGVMLNAWLVLYVVKLIFIVKAHFWSAGA